MESIIINVYVITPVHKVLHFKYVPNNARESLEKVGSFYWQVRLLTRLIFYVNAI